MKRTATAGLTTSVNGRKQTNGFRPHTRESQTCDSVANDIPRAASSNEVIDACFLARSNQGDRARLLTENKAGSIPAVPANPLLGRGRDGNAAACKAVTSGFDSRTIFQQSGRGIWAVPWSATPANPVRVRAPAPADLVYWQCLGLPSR